MSGPITISIEDGVGIIELSRPEKFNCLSSEVKDGIDAARERFETDDAVRAILIRAQGKHFCTGADLDEVKAARADKDRLQVFIEGGLAVLSRLEASPLPVVAAVQGLCLAGGTELMLACDVVFAARSAQFGDQHTQFGLIPGWGGSQRFPRIIGLRRAMDLFLSARWVSAEDAMSWGLVNYVSDDDALGDEAMAYCRKLTIRSRTGLAEMKRLARAGLEGTLEDGLRLEMEATVQHLQTDDVSEGLAAFEARREPNFP